VIETGEAAAERPRNVEAIAYILLSSVVFMLADAAMRQASSTLPVGEAVCLRSAGSVVLVLIAAIWTGALAGLGRAMVPMMGWRTVGDAGNSLTFQAALPRMPFADIMGVLQLTPLFLTAASAVFLGARVGWRRWTAVLVGLTGALLVIKPGTGAFNTWALVAVVSVLFGTLRDIATRRLDGGVSPLLMLLVSQSAIVLLALATMAIEPWVWPTATQASLLAVGATFTLVGNYWMIVALRIGDIAAVAPFRYAGIVWAIALGWLIWGEIPDPLALCGMALLVAAGIYAFYRERAVQRAAAQKG
jgi:drug/metabolite transporter (DMT)-like permease